MTPKEPRLRQEGQAFWTLHRPPGSWATSHPGPWSIGPTRCHSPWHLDHGHTEPTGAQAVIVVGIGVGEEPVNGSHDLTGLSWDKNDVSVEGIGLLYNITDRQPLETLRMP